jgi:hypothetical protein
VERGRECRRGSRARWAHAVEGRVTLTWVMRERDCGTAWDKFEKESEPETLSLSIYT